MVRYLVAAFASISIGACGGGDDGDYCLPQGQILIGALGTVGTPLTNYADCYSGASPVLSLDSARAATVEGEQLSFMETNITGTIDSESCRISIEYTYDTMLSDNTPATGTSTFAAAPNPGDPTSWDVDGEGSVIIEWGPGTVCGNTLTAVVIGVQD